MKRRIQPVRFDILGGNGYPGKDEPAPVVRPHDMDLCDFWHAVHIQLIKRAVHNCPEDAGLFLVDVRLTFADDFDYIASVLIQHPLDGPSETHLQHHISGNVALQAGVWKPDHWDTGLYKLYRDRLDEQAMEDAAQVWEHYEIGQDEVRV